MRRAARLCALTLVPLLASCSWMPWHKHASATDAAPSAQAPAPAATAAAIPPPLPPAPAATAAAPAAAAPTEAEPEHHSWLPWRWHKKQPAPAPDSTAAPVAAASAAAPATSESAPSAPQTAEAEPKAKRSWLPWRWHRKPAEAAPAEPPAAATSVAAAPNLLPPRTDTPPPPLPAAAAPAPLAAAPAASAAAPAVAPAPATLPPPPAAPSKSPTEALASYSEYAPLDELEWQELFADYQVLAQCEDRYMNSASLNSVAVGQRLVLLNKAGAIRTDALHLLDPASPLRRQWTDPAAGAADRQAQLVSDTLLDWMAHAPASKGLGRELARKATARYYVAQVTGHVCNPGPRYEALMRKAGE